MNNDRNTQNWEEHKNQNSKEESRGSKEETSNEQTPDNRLKDGTNDFQNGDQEPTSERSSDLENKSKQS